MSRPKRMPAAGPVFSKPNKPASVIAHGQTRRAVAGLFVLMIALITLVAVWGHPSPKSTASQPDNAPYNLDSNAGVFLMAAFHKPGEVDQRSRQYHLPANSGDMLLYREVFRLQMAGLPDEAQALSARIKDPSLMGHVLAQRYLSKDYKARFEELQSWLIKYADHPQAPAIARLASARRPDTFKGALMKASYKNVPIEETLETGMEAKPYASKVKRSAAQSSQAKAMIADIRRHVEAYEPSAALNLLSSSDASKYLDIVEKDRLRALIAAGYFYADRVDQAETLSRRVLERSRAGAPMAGWVNGLARWRQGAYAQAAESFEISALSPYASGWMVSASSYWAHRAHEKAGHARRGKQWLERASAYPRTFYGLLALNTLGKKADFNWQAPRLSASQEADILETDAGARAEKLLAAGQVTLAEAEIRSLYVKGDKDRKKALLAYAYDRKLPSLTLQLAHALSGDEDGIYDSALYPSMPWEPGQGFRVDRALIHAIIRQESRFDALAENKRSGATGLMQLMPLTANYVAEKDIYHEAAGKVLLTMPEVSLDIGQRYVEHLLNNPQVGQDLLSLAVAYNAGPGKLAKWKAERSDINDPLLFIESIPYAETRGFVERVLSNYWIYRMRFDQPNDSMQALAEGKWARYATLDMHFDELAER